MARKKTKPAARKKTKTGVCVGGKIVAKPCYTPNEVAEILGVGRATVADMMDADELQYEVAKKGPAKPQGFTRRDGKTMRPKEIRRITFEALVKHSPWIKRQLIKVKENTEAVL